MPAPLLKTEAVHIEIYKKVLSGKMSKFPRNFWKEETKSAPMLVRYLIEDVLEWGEEEIKEKFGPAILEAYKLSGLLKHVYQKRIFALMEDVYPGRFLPWEIDTVPNGFWQEEDHCVEATRWLLLEKLNWSKEDIMKYYNKNVFYENNFTGLLKWGWCGKTYKAVMISFPEYEFKPWELLAVPLTPLSKEDAVCAIQWYIEEKKKWNEEEIRKYWHIQTIQDDGIMRIVHTVFDNQLFKAIDAVYPNRFKPWEFPVESV